ncbi:hydrolase [Caldibacillus thermolactis]|uniref:Hydrolase n=1 Tax=Pallidibacillus thermolactis TaxID=251051 RepID=A0ABT2WGS6_9BACI|nr:hydrolase [Pallidibacillus thermolactis]MCU9594868.1 hydrolase [Pallidibacillus thermolactis]MCU9602459.1 hydrolase [Pallidibacillus thermolactis subsp. kokeshiiformis]MED1674031.1 hydrolase [Pallidibacillus thermolactis subsp. kokeshiiformis]
MNYRIFTLNNELCIIHYPYKPNGFGVLIIGGKEQYVEQNKSNWLDNYNRRNILEALMAEGYTVFYSNFGKEHMGNERSIEQVKDLYEYVKRTEILNEKIHIIAEGTGALIASNLLENKAGMIRSIVFINPIFSLNWLLDLLKNQPFMYKRALKVIADAYSIHEDQCEKLIKKKDGKVILHKLPYIIIHILEHGIQDNEWIQLYKRHFKNDIGNIQVLLPEKRSRILYYAKQLFKEAEIVL